MYVVDLKIRAVVLELLKVLSETLPTYDIYLAGGYLRDTFGDAPIKDLDIIVVPKESAVDPTSNVYWRVDTSCIRDWFRGTSVINSEYIEGMEARGVHGLLMGVSPNLDNMETQLIIYDHPMTHQEVAEDMDLNICQIAMDSHGLILATPEFVDGFAQRTIKVLNGQGEAREAERIQRMLKKYPKFSVK